MDVVLPAVADFKMEKKKKVKDISLGGGIPLLQGKSFCGKKKEIVSL